MPDIVFPTIVSARTAQVLHVESQFAAFETMPRERQQQVRNRQLGALLSHARDKAPFWAERLASLGGSVRFEDLPVLTRADLQAHGERMRAVGPLPGGGAAGVYRSSGSTGRPVEVVKDTALDRMLYLAQYLRMHRWHSLDANQNALDIRDEEDGALNAPWGQAWAELGATGRGERRSMVNHSPESLWAWLRGETAPYLFTTPTMALRLAHLALAETHARRLDAIITFGEVVTPEIRDAVRHAFGARIIDRYSCEEGGWLAFQCPRHDHLHVAAASVHLEIVGDDNRPVKPGEEGRVLITPLHGYAQPLIRYDLGDRAVAGEACDCGLTLPVIRQVLGRERSFIAVPGGGLRLARLTGEYWRAVAPVDEYRVVQYRDGVIEAFVTAARPLTPTEIGAAEAMLRQVLHPGLETVVTQVATIDWPSRWKRVDITRVDWLRGQAPTAPDR
jgi:phenylacetate-CoA ligase